MICENKEGYSDFDMDPDWWKNRPRGISAVIRCYNDFDILGWCIESILPLVDEIVVTYTPVENDLTVDVCKGFNDKKIKCFEYPFKMKKMGQARFKLNEISSRSVHDFAYYTNWGMTKTTYSHVAPRWDADQVMRPEYARNQDFKYKILKHHSTWVYGYNVMDVGCTTISEKHPYQGIPNGEPRFIKAGPFVFLPGSLNNSEGDYYSWPYYLTMGIPRFVSYYSNFLLGGFFHVKDPIFFHLKYLRGPSNDKTVPKGGYNAEETRPILLDGVEHPDFMKKTLKDYISGGQG